MRLKAISAIRGMSPAEAAAHWVVREEAGTLSERDSDELAGWLEDPVHADAYRRAASAIALFSDDSGADANLRALRQSALDAVPAPRPRYLLVATGALAASVAAFAGWVAIDRPGAVPGRAPTELSSAGTVRTAGGDTVVRSSEIDYSTGIGERRQVRLGDGSLVTLNTGTKLTVAFSESRRLVHLVRGQALFEVAHDASRPFTVEAANRQVTALGTIFEVRLDPGRVKVVLIRGRVLVDRGGDNAGSADETAVTPTILKPGESLDVELGTPQKVAMVDVDRQLMWRTGFVEFQNESLGHAVAELNRYSTRPISLSNDGVAGLRVSGLFHTGSPDQFIDAVQALLPVEAHPNTQGGVELALRKQ